MEFPQYVTQRCKRLEYALESQPMATSDIKTAISHINRALEHVQAALQALDADCNDDQHEQLPLEF